MQWQDPDKVDALVLWDDTRERQAVYRILAATGARVRYAAAIEDALQIDCRLFVVDSCSARGQLPALMQHLSCPGRQCAMLLVTDDSNYQQILDLFSHDVLTNVVAKNTALRAQELVITVQKLLRNDIFGMEKYLSWGVQCHVEMITSSQQKGVLLEQVDGFLAAIGCNRRLAELATAVADEFIMNGVYNAPVDPSGQPKYASLARSQRVDLEPGEEVEFRYACDGRVCAISVRDSFGRLKRSKVVEYLKRCLDKNGEQIDSKEGGAGLGLYYSFESLNSFLINVSKNQCTEMIGLLDVSGNYRDFARQPKSLHLFFEENVDE